MKLTILGIIAIAAIALAQQPGSGQTSADMISVRGCLEGNGSDQTPWMLRGAVLPAPRPAAPPPATGGGRGDGGGRGAGGRGGGGGGQAPGGDGRGAAPAGRGGDGRGAPPAAAPAPPQPRVDLRVTGMDLTPWRNMFVELGGTLGQRPASGPQEFKVETARSAYGDCR